MRAHSTLILLLGSAVAVATGGCGPSAPPPPPVPPGVVAADQAARWEATEAIAASIPRETFSTVHNAFRPPVTPETFSAAAAAVDEWARTTGTDRPPTLPPEPTMAEIEAAYFEMSDFLLPYSYNAVIVARAAFLMAHNCLKRDDADGAHAWMEFAVEVIVRRGRDPIPLSRLGAYRILDGWFTTSETLGLESLRSELERCWCATDPGHAEEVLDLPRSIEFAGRWYGHLLAVHPEIFNEENGFEFPMWTNNRALGEEVARVLSELAEVWDQPDAPTRLREIAATFEFPRCDVFVRWYDTKNNQDEAARERLRLLRAGN